MFWAHRRAAAFASSCCCSARRRFPLLPWRIYSQRRAVSPCDRLAPDHACQWCKSARSQQRGVVTMRRRRSLSGCAALFVRVAMRSAGHAPLPPAPPSQAVSCRSRKCQAATLTSITWSPVGPSSVTLRLVPATLVASTRRPREPSIPVYDCNYSRDRLSPTAVGSVPRATQTFPPPTSISIVAVRADGPDIRCPADGTQGDTLFGGERPDLLLGHGVRYSVSPRRALNRAVVTAPSCWVREPDGTRLHSSRPLTPMSVVPLAGRSDGLGDWLSPREARRMEGGSW